MVLSTSAFCQDFYKISKTVFQIYNGRNWVENRVTYPEGLFVIIKSNEITITNKKESKFIIYGDYEESRFESHTTYTWNCYDEEGKSCICMLKVPKYNNTICFTFMYDNYCFDYIGQKQ